MTARLIDPISGRVRVYRGVLSCLGGEQVLAVYPERVIMTCVARVKILLTCGLEYCLRWRKRRQEGAIILTDRRIVQVSTLSSQFRRSLKVDMYTVGPTVKYVSLNPPTRTCCSSPTGRIACSTRCGVLELNLVRMPRRRECALQLWLALGLLQDAPSVASVELGEWVTVVDELPEEPDDAEAREGAELEAQRLSAAIWGEGMGLEALAEPEPHDSASQVGNPGGGVLTLGDARARAEQWGLALAAGERVLWGPCLFDDELQRLGCGGQRRSPLKRPSALVTITDSRLIVLQFKSWGLLACGGLCHRTTVHSMAVVPLRWVLGFCIDESFALQQAVLARLLGACCCRPLSESALTVRVLTNAGLGKVYLASLAVKQRTLPRGAAPACSFEEERVLELRRWLGHVALFFGEQLGGGTAEGRAAVELWRCPRGWTP